MEAQIQKKNEGGTSATGELYTVNYSKSRPILT